MDIRDVNGQTAAEVALANGHKARFVSFSLLFFFCFVLDSFLRCRWHLVASTSKLALALALAVALDSSRCSVWESITWEIGRILTCIVRFFPSKDEIVCPKLRVIDSHQLDLDES